MAGEKEQGTGIREQGIGPTYPLSGANHARTLYEDSEGCRSPVNVRERIGRAKLLIFNRLIAGFRVA